MLVHVIAYSDHLKNDYNDLCKFFLCGTHLTEIYCSVHYMNCVLRKKNKIKIMYFLSSFSEEGNLYNGGFFFKRKFWEFSGLIFSSKFQSEVCFT